MKILHLCWTTSENKITFWKIWENQSMYYHNKAQQSKNRVHISWDILYDGKDKHWQINWWIKIMQNIKVLSNHEHAWLAHECKFGEKIAWFNIFQYYMIKINHWVQMIIDITEFIKKRVVFLHLTIIAVSKYNCFHDKNFLGNHKYMASHYIMYYNTVMGNKDQWKFL